MTRPTISIIIPTLNAASVLKKCLQSIAIQDYPKNKIGIIVADGGSTDETIVIAQKYQARIIKNPLKTAEAGKAVALKQAQGEIIALIDSDNILPHQNWLRQMTEPFIDQQITISEPISYTYRQEDPLLTRYFALLGMNDPICLFIGNYDRISTLTGKWTNLKFPQQDKGNYLKISLDHQPIPTIGANGTLIRQQVFNQLPVNDYLFDIDIPLGLIKKQKVVYLAKVKTGIIHTFVEKDITKFFRKQMRRINDLSFHQSQESRTINWEKSFFWEIVYFQLQCLLIFPILYQTLKGYLRKPDPAWLFHPLACYSTWLIYLYGWIRGKINPQESSRSKWTQ